ncbi:hypothetical protein J4E91_003210 [Alternaria rosae]|nr:hypothetical protein J4E91_003210 [Alternaria rosae]
MPINNSSIQTGDLTVDRSSRISELEATQTSLLELMFRLIKDRADNVGKDEYLKLIEKRLRELEKTIRQQRESLNDSERECQHLALAAKMYRVKSEMRDSGSESESQPAPAAKRVKVAKERIVVCISCFRNGRRCDSGEPCQSCLKNRSKCQSAKCANYKAGKCSFPTCTRTHEDDERKYKRVVHSGHVSKKDMAVVRPKISEDV